MFYTKYRPQKFSDISKPNDTAFALMNQVKDGKVGHAYLFIGSRGTGKTTTARILAKALNCSDLSKEGDPCGKCSACEAIRIGSFMDLIEIDAASNRGIDDIRDLRDKIKLAPSGGKQKVYIIDEVHMLTTEAFNALLKTLEEPPEHATFILCTTEGHKVPDTIKSRCLVFTFKRATEKQLVKKLEEILGKEGIKGVPTENLLKIARASLGGFRDAETLLQQVVEGGLDVDSFLMPNSYQSHVSFVDSLIKQDANLALKLINNLYEEGVDLHVWTLELVKYLRDLLFISVHAQEGLMDVTQEIYSSMEEQSAKLTSKEVVLIIEVLIKAQNEIKSSPIPQLPLELAVVSICNDFTGTEVSSKNESPKKPSPKKGQEVDANESTQDAPEEEIAVETGEEYDATEENGENGENFSQKEAAHVKFEELERNWDDVLKASKKYNNSVSALLKSCKLISIEGKTIFLEVFYSFHKERIETPKNRTIVEQSVEEVFGFLPFISCSLSKEKPQTKGLKETGELTDYNVAVPVQSDVSDGSLLDVFDGGLPM